MRFLPVNATMFLVELADLKETLALVESLGVKAVAGIVEMVPAAKTIMIQYDPLVATIAQLVAELKTREFASSTMAIGKLVEIPVNYNGEDLAEVAAILKISVAELIKKHTQTDYTVAFIGYAPGFAYLTGGDAHFNIPRRATPRIRVPAGSVGLAGAYTAVYPKEGPGGWQIIGQTDTAMWDITRNIPALLQPGFRVRFTDAAALDTPKKIEPHEIPAMHGAPKAEQYQPHHPPHHLEIMAVGIQTTFQDLGRSGHVHQGVGSCGALDRSAFKTANRIVGNHFNAAALEIAAGGLQFRCHGSAVIAITGAAAPLHIQTATGISIHAQHYQPIALEDGDTVRLGIPNNGVRSYLAVRGSFAVPPVLGSVACDTLAHIGPKPIAMGDQLNLQSELAAVKASLPVAIYEQAAFIFPTAQHTITLDIFMGPRTDWFTPAAIEWLHTQKWQVSPHSNRIGIRLIGEQVLQRFNHAELPSEGTAIGSIQVPASGQPILFLADRPLTGGYPVIAVVADYHLDLAGQIPVNAWVKFNPITQFSEIDV